MAQPATRRLMTLEEFAALPEDNSARYELQEGVLLVSPGARRAHQQALVRLLVQVDGALPAGWSVLPDVELVVRRAEPAIVRVPDLVVVRDGDPEDVRLSPFDVALAVEIISPGSRNLDLHLEPFEYAEAGIPRYWVVDLGPPAPTVTVFTPGAPGEGYVEQPAVAGELRATVTLGAPVELTVDVAALG